MKYVYYFYRVISAILLLLFSCLPRVANAQTIAQSIAAAEKPVSQVAIMTVSNDVALVRQVLGMVFAPQMQTISSQVTAVVTSDRLGMGTRVEKGEVLVSLDSREADAKLALAQSEMISARIHLEKQTLDFARVEHTFAKKLISKADYDNAKLALRRASNDLKGFEAKYEVAKIFVEKHRILAPFSGVLMSSTPVVGLQLSPGQQVVNILNADELRIKTLLTRDELTKISKGQAQLLESNQPETSFRLLHAAPNANDNNGMFAAEFAIITLHALAANHLGSTPGNAGQLTDDFQADFYSGQALKLELFENKIHLPAQAILPTADRDYVMTVSNDQVMKVAIKDLVVGQQVVVHGPSHLAPGDKVAILALEE
jgi:RND family efflux transporter MFP subunit